jgi:hypothetical protein
MWYKVAQENPNKQEGDENIGLEEPLLDPRLKGEWFNKQLNSISTNNPKLAKYRDRFGSTQSTTIAYFIGYAADIIQNKNKDKETAFREMFNYMRKKGFNPQEEVVNNIVTVFNETFNTNFKPIENTKQVEYSGKGKVSPAGLVQLALNAGFSSTEAPNMAAIALAESGGNPRAHNPNPPDNSYGLWQINMLGSLEGPRKVQFGISSNEELFDPAVNARAARKVFKSQGYGAWSVYKNRSYAQYLPVTREAYALLQNKGTLEGEIGEFNPVNPFGKGLGLQ